MKVEFKKCGGGYVVLRCDTWTNIRHAFWSGVMEPDDPLFWVSLQAAASFQTKKEAKSKWMEHILTS